MSKLTYAALGASALVALASLGARVLEAQTPPGSGGTCASGVPCPLDCTNAAASPALIWPPDHKMVQENITVPNATSIEVTSIHQDEPIETLGSGNTEPDGVIAAPPTTAYVRAERSGLGMGRLYVIEFRATDMTTVTTTGQCMGKVGVFVPHDQEQAHDISALIGKPGFTFPDTGLRCNSTAVGQAAETCTP